MTNQYRKVLATAFAYLMTLGIVGTAAYILVLYLAGFYILYEQSWRGVIALSAGVVAVIVLPVLVARSEWVRMSAK